SAPRIHDLVALLASCVEIEPRLAALEEDCRRLTTFGTAVRYPTPLGEPTPADGRAMVEAAERVRKQVLALLGKATQ
ncbi:MAG: HEPN domain-containing protein, partial [Candidatus Bipolaricaulota bacterium]|nr:HEPN domain-containing protein [Candidatus Bipolaricaulota bacterium]